MDRLLYQEELSTLEENLRSAGATAGTAPRHGTEGALAP